jgi:hypothetical protein
MEDLTDDTIPEFPIKWQITQIIQKSNTKSKILNSNGRFNKSTRYKIPNPKLQIQMADLTNDTNYQMTYLKPPNGRFKKWPKKQIWNPQMIDLKPQNGKFNRWQKIPNDWFKCHIVRMQKNDRFRWQN